MLAEQVRIEDKDAQRKIIPSRKWCELIKKIWEVDPLICPECQGKMRIISLINDPAVIEDILGHLGIWEDRVYGSSHDPPLASHQAIPSVVYESVYDDFQNMPDEYPRNEII